MIRLVAVGGRDVARHHLGAAVEIGALLHQDLGAGAALLVAMHDVGRAGPWAGLGRRCLARLCASAADTAPTANAATTATAIRRILSSIRAGNVVSLQADFAPHHKKTPQPAIPFRAHSRNSFTILNVRNGPPRLKPRPRSMDSGRMRREATMPRTENRAIDRRTVRARSRARRCHGFRPQDRPRSPRLSGRRGPCRHGAAVGGAIPFAANMPGGLIPGGAGAGRARRRPARRSEGTAISEIPRQGREARAARRSPAGRRDAGASARRRDHADRRSSSSATTDTFRRRTRSRTSGRSPSTARSTTRSRSRSAS